ncbi:MAG: cupin domain-containing protein [Candidatus Acidiferrales bacterium]
MGMGIAEFPPDAAKPRQKATGPEVCYVLEGEVTVKIEGQPAKIFDAGETFQIPQMLCTSQPPALPVRKSLSRGSTSQGSNLTSRFQTDPSGWAADSGKPPYGKIRFNRTRLRLEHIPSLECRPIDQNGIRR